MPDGGRSPKRRRLTPERSSSPDELSTTTTPFDSAKKPSYITSSSGHLTVKPPLSVSSSRISGGARVSVPGGSSSATGTPTTTRYSYAIDDEDESPDELENDVHSFYRGRRKPSRQESSHRPRDTPGAVGSKLRHERRFDDDDDDDRVEQVRDYYNTARTRRRGGTDGAMEDKQDEEEQGEEDDEHRHNDDDEDEDQNMHTPHSRTTSATPPPPPRKLTPAEKWRPWRLKFTLAGHRRGVAQVKISPDGRKIASCSADATIRIWDAITGRSLHVLQGHLAGISTIAWSPDSETLASGSDDKSIRLWNAATGSAYATPLVGHHNYVYAIAFSPKGNMLVSGSYDEAVFLWDVRGARVMRSLPAHSDPVGGVDFVHDGTLIVSCAGDGLVRIWDTATGQCLRTLVQEERAPVVAVHFSPNGRYVLASTLDSCLRLWDYVNGRCLKTYQGHRNVKYSVGATFGLYGPTQPSDQDAKPDVFVASASEDGRIVCWDITTKEILQTIDDAHDGPVLGLHGLLSKGLMASAGIDGLVKIWEIESDDPVHGREASVEAKEVRLDADGDAGMTTDTALPQTNHEQHDDVMDSS